MLYLRRTKQELKSDVVLKGKDILIPIWDYDLVCLCPTCNKTVGVDFEILLNLLNEGQGFEEIGIYCDFCGKRIIEERKNERTNKGTINS